MPLRFLTSKTSIIMTQTLHDKSIKGDVSSGVFTSYSPHDQLAPLTIRTQKPKMLLLSLRHTEKVFSEEEGLSFPDSLLSTNQTPLRTHLPIWCCKVEEDAAALLQSDGKCQSFLETRGALLLRMGENNICLVQKETCCLDKVLHCLCLMRGFNAFVFVNNSYIILIILLNMYRKSHFSFL